MKAHAFWSLVLSSLLVTAFSFAQANENLPRVPYVFTGDSKAYQNFSPYRYTQDSRDSRDYAEYYLNEGLLDDIRRREGIWGVHAMVRNIAVDGLCGDYSQCFRVYIFVNGDEVDGVHVATFVVSPGTGRRTPLYNDRPLRNYNPQVRYLRSYEKPGIYKNKDMYRVYGSKSYPGRIPNMPNAMFFARSIALHGSFDRVDGNKRSHGCIRMFPDESYWLNSLVREADGNLIVDVLHTR